MVRVTGVVPVVFPFSLVSVLVSAVDLVAQNITRSLLFHYFLSNIISSLITQDISHYSHILNLIFSFAALETSHAFPNTEGPSGFLAIQGRAFYHCVHPTHANSAVRWLLYDGFMQNIPYPAWAALLPPTWINAMRDALQSTSPFVTAL